MRHTIQCMVVAATLALIAAAGHRPDATAIQFTAVAAAAALSLAAAAGHRPDATWPYKPPDFPDACLGEYSFCNSTKSCVLDSQNASACAACGAGEYLCPDWRSCAKSAQRFSADCAASVSGTHLDATLSDAVRLAYIVAHTNLTDWISQLHNNAKAIPKLSIPSYNWLNDDVHGIQGPHGTAFPDGCGLGASWNKELMHAVGKAIGSEARSAHNGYVHDGDRGGCNTAGGVASKDCNPNTAGENGAGITLYGPNINLVRDPRWGRSQETYGECPTLTSKLTVPFVRGAQGFFAANNSAVDSRGRLLAGSCCKHLAAYDVEGIPEERSSFSAFVTAQQMWDFYLQPFESCINEAQAMHVMTALNAINGVAASADAGLLDGLLRDPADGWNFSGFVVTDYGAFEAIGGSHGCSNKNADKALCCNDTKCAAWRGFSAGLDQDGGGSNVIVGPMSGALQYVPALVASGKLSASRIQASFRRMMLQRLRLGMFDPPAGKGSNSYNELTFEMLESVSHTALSRTAAQNAICMYHNRNSALPLNMAADFSAPGSLLVAGWGAADGDNLFGNYIQHTDRAGVNASILAGFAGALHVALPPLEPPDDAGDGAKAAAASPLVYEIACSNNGCPKKDLLKRARAVRLAKAAKATVLVLGLVHNHRNNDDAGASNQPGTENEGHDRSTIAFPGEQLDLAEKLSRKNTGTALICVLVHGGSLAPMTLMDSCDAVLDAWYPGDQGGKAVADVVFGKVSPAGRTPQTWYTSDADMSKPGNMALAPGLGTDKSSPGQTYRYYNKKPAIPFGFGMSYTNFTYANLKLNASGATLSRAELCRSGGRASIGATVEVTNTGRVASDEVIQLYAQKSRAQLREGGGEPAVRLLDFARVRIAPGETRSVALAFGTKELALTSTSAAAGAPAAGERVDLYHPTLTVAAGEVALFAGGGQPQFYAGGAKVTVRIPAEVRLNRSYQCKKD